MYFTLKNVLHVSNRRTSICIYNKKCLLRMNSLSVQNLEDVFQSKIHKESTSCWSYFIISSGSLYVDDILPEAMTRNVTASLVTV